MELLTWVYIFIALFVGFIIGFIVNGLTRKARDYTALKRELEETKLQLSTQKQFIMTHFSQNADILDKMSRNFKKLYRDMMEDSLVQNNSEQIKQLEKSLTTEGNEHLVENEKTSLSDTEEKIEEKTEEKKAASQEPDKLK